MTSKEDEKPLTPAEKLRRGAEEMGRRFDQITSDAKKAGDLIRKETDKRKKKSSTDNEDEDDTSQRSSTELVRGARLSLAEKVLVEYLSSKAYGRKLKGSMDKFRRTGKSVEKEISRRFPGTDADYFEGRGAGVGMTGTKKSKKQDDADAEKLIQRRKERIDRVKKGRVGRFGQLLKPTKLSRKGFDDQDMPNRPAKKVKPSFDYGSRNVGDRRTRKTTLKGIKDLLSGRRSPNY